MRRAVVSAMLAFLAVVLVPSAAIGQAPVPTLNVGDTTAFGTRLDLGPVESALEALVQMDANITINRLNFTGSLDAWNVFEVVEKTSSTVRIAQDSAFGLKAHLILDVTNANASVPGVYQGTPSGGFCLDPSIPTETRSMNLDASVSWLETAPGTSTWNVSDLALRSTETNSTLTLRATVTARGVPMQDTNLTTCLTSVTYENFYLGIDADVKLDVRTQYSPALDLFDFPIVDGESWWANSTATVGARMAGRIDVRGLDPDLEAQLFDALNQAFAGSGITVTGLTGFPIILEQITVRIGAANYINNGVIQDVPVPVAIPLNATFNPAMTLADGQFHPVYLIGIGQASMSGGAISVVYGGLAGRWIYSPDDGFIVGFVYEVAPGLAIFELEPVPAATARTRIQETKANYAPSSGGDPITGFFLNPPYLGLILLGAAVVVISALLVLRRRKPAAAPPRPPPPMPPPPTAPPPGNPPWP